MIASFRFEWSFAREMTEEQHSRLLKVLPDLPALPIVKEKGHYENMTGDIRQVLRAGGKIELGGDREKEVSYMLALDEKLDRLADKIGKLQTVHEEHHHSFNAKCSVHVPGLGLMMIDQVEIKEDCCTNEVDALLKEGWRILAICPQPDQRRPDYVLGKSSKTPFIIADVKHANDVARLEGVF